MTFNNVNNKFCTANNFSTLYIVYKYNNNVPFVNLNFHTQPDLQTCMHLWDYKV